ncbi:MAG: PadR family transcriptional regulator [Bryobacteraceae bacterium]|jgi:DNA-binding PadR family transcriptional regulator
MPKALELPLTPAVFFTLLALAGGEKHGYAIMQETRNLSDGSVRMGPATLYTTIQRLLEQDFVEEVSGDREADSRRRYYRLTRGGRALVDMELERVEALVKRARALQWKPARVKS